MILFTVTFGLTLAGLNIGTVFAFAFQKCDPESRPGCQTTICQARYPLDSTPRRPQFLSGAVARVPRPIWAFMTAAGLFSPWIHDQMDVSACG
jgi:hypothetical protein